MNALAHDSLAREAYARSPLANSPFARLGPLVPPLSSIAGGLALVALRHNPHGAGGVEMAACAIAALAGLAATRQRLRGAGLLLAALALLLAAAAALVGMALDGAAFLPAGASALAALALGSLAAGAGLGAGQR
ncbi:hypothetical protein FBZ87_104291 [Nitrospirillum amazonense]|uniref:Uncharacterized protein n=1 Tax=Nitrospirillum amazonense TaxID=28077 RepID=A0A560JWV3_9PROT|nr:hypothetical protein [Nitrospirillum amazonense]TWB75189.1 hypothetical protein FBZ87_104291 [Nitrospirillum amazonense]